MGKPIIASGRTAHIHPKPSELETNMAFLTFFFGGVFMALAVLPAYGPIESPRFLSGYFLSAGLGFTFLSLAWMFFVPDERRIVWT